MPLATHPRRTLAVWLAVDADLPEHERPVFLCRFLSKVDSDTQQEEFASLRDAMRASIEAGDEPAYAAAHKRLEALLAACVTGWRNMTNPRDGKPLDFAPDAFGKVMDTGEMLELADLALSRTQCTETDSKKSPPSSSSDADNSAPAVAGASAAKTS